MRPAAHHDGNTPTDPVLRYIRRQVRWDVWQFEACSVWGVFQRIFTCDLNKSFFEFSPHLTFFFLFKMSYGSNWYFHSLLRSGSASGRWSLHMACISTCILNWIFMPRFLWFLQKFLFSMSFLLRICSLTSKCCLLRSGSNNGALLVCTWGVF